MIKSMMNSGEGERRKLQDKHYNKVDKFTGQEGTWKKFNHKFMVATKMADKVTEQVLKKIMTIRTEMSIDEVVEMEGFTGDKEAVKERSGELYDILSLLCEGEALQVVDSIVSMDGFRAYKKLQMSFNVVTVAGTMSKVIAVVAPPKVVDLKQMTSMVEDWEAKERDLKNESDEMIPDKFRMAILTTMCPTAIQEWIFQQTDKDTNYIELKAKILSIVSNRVSMSATPMDIGAMGKGREHQGCDHGQGHYEEAWHHQGDYEGPEEYEVGAVGQGTQCYKCKGWGHMARECATKGDGKGDNFGKGDFGKGDKGKGKGLFGGYGAKGSGGSGKGFGKDYGKGYGKGKGKSFQGECFKCGKKGHRAFECRSVNGVEEWAEGEDAEEPAEVKKNIGTVWAMAMSVTKAPKNVEVKNRFETLDEAEDEEDENEVVEVEEPPGLEKKKTASRPKMKRVKKWAKLNQDETEGQDSLRPQGQQHPSQKGTQTQILSAYAGGENAFALNEIGVGLKQTTAKFSILGSGGKSEAKYIGGLTRERQQEKEKGNQCAIMFHLTNSTKMLVSVERLAAAGNHIHFGPEQGDNFIINKRTGRKMQMQKKGGVYEIEVMFKCGATWQSGILTIDSGAEECVMPRNWYPDVEVSPKKDSVRFMGADGTDLGNYGRKLMEFVPKGEWMGFARRTT